MTTLQASFLDHAAPAGRPHELPIPPDARIVRCRSCGAQIVWAHTPAGRAVPLALSTVQTRDGTRYAQSHFLDCPHAGQWSK